MNKYIRKMHAIAAVSSDGGLGYQNKLLFRDSLDKTWFYNITLGHTVLMGRKTYESIGGPLPNRTNVVLSSQKIDVPPNVILLDDTKFLEFYLDLKDTYVIGGGSVYEQLLPDCQYLHLTTFYEKPENEPDCYFPKIDENMWKITDSVVGGTFADGSVRLRFETFVRKD